MRSTGSGANTRPSGEREADDALDEVYRTQSPGLLRYLRRRIGNLDDAQDIAQEAMLRYIRVAPADRIVTPQAYLRRIAANLISDWHSGSSHKVTSTSVPLIEGLDFETAVDPHREVAGRDELAHWRLILSQLKPRTLEIFLLSRVDGFTYREIADNFGMTVWNVKRHMRAAIGHVDRHREAR